MNNTAVNNTTANNTTAMITLSEAEKLTGLQRSTLSRFAEAGYFATTTNDRGEQLYSLEEICKLFNIDRPANTDQLKIRTNYNPSNALSSVNSCGETGRSSADFADGTYIAGIPNQPAGKIVDFPVTIQIEPVNIPVPPAVLTENKEIKPEPEQAVELRRLQNIIRGQEHEILKLQKVIELQEQLLDTRETEIRDHKKQRRWLQERVEKQDLKSERDQLLLISEMQMLTKMYVQQHNKKSLVIQTLEWLGFKNPDSPMNNNQINFKK